MYAPTPTTINLSGLNNSVNRFRTDLRSIIRKGVVAASKPIQKAYQLTTNAHRSPQNPVYRRDRRSGAKVVRPHLADSVTVKIWQVPDSSGYMAFIGPQSGVAPHAHLLEWGTAERRQITTGRRTGIGPALHLMQIAYNYSIGEAQGAFQQVLDDGLKQMPPL